MRHLRKEKDVSPERGLFSERQGSSQGRRLVLGRSGGEAWGEHQWLKLMLGKMYQSAEAAITNTTHGISDNKNSLSHGLEAGVPGQRASG